MQSASRGPPCCTIGPGFHREQRDAIEAMIEMLDETPFVERYALYNWVEETRMLVRDDGSLTPAGEIYRDQNSPVFFTQP